MAGLTCLSKLCVNASALEPDASAQATPDAATTAVDAGGDAGAVSADAGAAGADAGAVGSDAGEPGGDAGELFGDAGTVLCAWGGAPGQCMTLSACAALGDHTSFAGLCPGPADVQCCIVTPSPADNPPIPAGYKLMQQADVTADMTTWAVAILHDPVTYPMFATTTKTFGTLTVLARVEWHPPDFQNNVVHRGVTLYEPV